MKSNTLLKQVGNGILWGTVGMAYFNTFSSLNWTGGAGVVAASLPMVAFLLYRRYDRPD